MTAVVEDDTVRGGTSEVQQVRFELGAIWQAYGCLIPALISGGSAETKKFTTEFDKAVIALKKAKEGTIKEGEPEYKQTLAVARALIKEIAGAIHKATEKKAVLIT